MWVGAHRYRKECGEMATDTSVDTVVVQIGVLDWEACTERWGQHPVTEVYFDPKFPARALWYLTQGVYKMYYISVENDQSQITLCERAWDAQGNNYFSEKAVPMERSFSMGDIVVLSNETVWLCTKGWQCLNPGVI
jgi:hypothetical protein